MVMMMTTRRSGHIPPLTPLCLPFAYPFPSTVYSFDFHSNTEYILTQSPDPPPFFCKRVFPIVAAIIIVKTNVGFQVNSLL